MRSAILNSLAVRRSRPRPKTRRGMSRTTHVVRACAFAYMFRRRARSRVRRRPHATNGFGGIGVGEPCLSTIKIGAEAQKAFGLTPLCQMVES